MVSIRQYAQFRSWFFFWRRDRVLQIVLMICPNMIRAFVRPSPPPPSLHRPLCSYQQELIRKTQDSVIKEKEDEDARMKAQAKRLDYITRALRLEEMPVLRNKYNAQVRR